jgi:hypothetical protein
MNNKVWEKQGWHALALAILLMGAIGAANWLDLTGSFLGLSVRLWYWLAIAVPVVHQVYVVVLWRLELHHGWMSRVFGSRALTVFGAGFLPLFAGRLVTAGLLAAADAGSIGIPGWLRLMLAVVLTIPALYLGYSVLRYFGLKRALGADHFDPAYRQLRMVREGIFRYTNNGMYVYGFFLLWAVAVAFDSRAALIAAAFNHLYIWVHFFTVEKPDMEEIYG